MHCYMYYTTFLNELYCSGHVSLFCLHYVTYILTKESDEKKDKKKSLPHATILDVTISNIRNVFKNRNIYKQESYNFTTNALFFQISSVN